MTSKPSRTTAKAESAEPPAPAAVEVEPLAEEIPAPTRIKALWFPAQVLLPDRTTLLQRAKVYAAEEGLYVFQAVPQDPNVPDWYAPVDYTLRDKPPTGYAAYNGFNLETGKGVITVTLDRGCGCGWPLKRWTPEWAKRIVVW